MSSQDANLYNRRGTLPAGAAEPKSEEPIKVDGFGQVIQLLQVADAQFRESLLKRLAQRDPELARNLRKFLETN